MFSKNLLIVILVLLLLLFLVKVHKNQQLTVSFPEKGKGIVTDVQGNQIVIDFYFFDVDSRQKIYDNNGNVLNLSSNSSQSNGMVSTIYYTSLKENILSVGDLVYYDLNQAEPMRIQSRHSAVSTFPVSYTKFGQANQNLDGSFTSRIKYGQLKSTDYIVYLYMKDGEYYIGKNSISNLNDDGKIVSFTLPTSEKIPMFYYYVQIS